MNFLPRTVVATLLVAAGPLAHAGLHSICYEGPTRVKLSTISPTTVMQETLTMVVGCIDDSGARCAITPIGADLPSGASPAPLQADAQTFTAMQRVATPGTFEFYEYSQSNTMFTPRATRLRAAITFANGRVTECEVLPRGYIAAPWAANGSPHYVGQAYGVLTGFSTDASGLATTGVWRASQRGSVAQAVVPADFIVVGGGAAAADGAFIERSTFTDASDTLRGWDARSYGSNNSTLIRPTGETFSYAIGLRIKGLAANLTPLVPDSPTRTPQTDLRALVGRVAASSLQLAPGQPYPAWNVALPVPGVVSLGGGARASATINARNNTGHGVFAMASHPLDGLIWLRCSLLAQQLWTPCAPPQATGWRTEAISEWGFYAGDIDVAQAHLPAKIEIDGKIWEVRGRMVSATAPLTQGPGKANATGLRGDYAVVGVGGSVNWKPFNRWQEETNTWLARLEPRLDLGGAAVESRGGAVPGFSSLTAYAVGIRLVPEGTPPDVVERVHNAVIDLPWLCTVAPWLRESSACLVRDSVAKLTEFCGRFPDMPKYGLCK